MMQIIVKSEAYTYIYDSTTYDSENEQYFPSVEEAVEAALRLLCNSFKPELVEEAAHNFVL